MSILGIDLSLTSPSLCIYDNNGVFDLDHVKIYYLTDVNKSIMQNKYLTGIKYPDYQTQEDRYHVLSSWVLDRVKEHKVKQVFIEGYAFNAVGRVFQIAENTGVLKYRLKMVGLNTITVPPTVIKKYATGKGNANKEVMQASFLHETGINLKNTLSLTEKQWNPSSDIIDSYYVCKYGALEYGKEK